MADRKLYDPVRKKFVADTPEERVRQALLQQMLGPLGFSSSLIAVEKKIGRAGRRADVIAYAKSQIGLIPILLVECKADQAVEDAQMQLDGYNFFLDAPFLCIAHKTGIRTYWSRLGSIQSVPFLPPYEQLVSQCQNLLQN